MALTGYWSGNVYYHNTPEYANALQQEIARQNGGKTLELPTIMGWLAHEGQAPANATDTNPLNIWAGSPPGSNKTGSGLEVGTKGANELYATPQAGIQATAYLITHGSSYGGIRSTLAPAGQGDPIAQATAIQSSAWAGSKYGGALVGTVAKLVGKTIPVISNPNDGAIGPEGPVGPDDNPPKPTGKTLADFLGIDPATPLTLQIIQDAAHKYAAANASGPGDARAYAGAYNNILNLLQAWLGKVDTAGDVPFNVDANGHNTGEVVVPSPTQLATGDTQRGSILDVDLLALVGGLLDPENWAYILALAIGIPMAGFGLVRLSR